MAAIDIGAQVGAAAIDPTPVATIIAKDNPANLSGKITDVEIHADVALTDVEVATFVEGVANTFTTRDTELIGDVGIGITHHVVDLDVVAGDYIGICATSGELRSDGAGGAGLWYVAEDQIPCTDKLFALLANRIMWVYGTGAELPAGWTGKISGVTNPAKVMGVGVANIAKVKGIA